LFANNRVGMANMQRCIEKLEHENCQLHTTLAELSQKEAESSYLAYHDSLTALPNRRLLIDRFRQATIHADRHQEHVALLFIDLDRFKRVNDECGHVVGDKVLQMVATRIQTAIRATDTACRYGGDEFVVMLPEIESAAIAVDLADKIRRRLGIPYEIDAGVIDLNASVGIAAYPRDGRVWEMLVGHAGAAMHRAKHKHRDGSAASSRLAANGPFRLCPVEGGAV
ncbi:MAG: diguanylate cyclase domain-containing protein, partial [Rudaea sp.]